ncbi:peptidoglycan DD-metalloendopeptidase family protein [soil metagenome]
MSPHPSLSMQVNMRIRALLVLGIFLTFSLCMVAQSQDRNALEKQRKKLESDIKRNKELLDKVGQDKKSSLSQLELLLSQISTRQKVISNLNRELELLNGQIGENDAIINALEKDLKQLKKQYAEMLYYAYKHNSKYSDVAFIFSAKTLSQAYNRMRYLQRLAEFRLRQAEMIKETVAALSEKLIELNSKKKAQQELLSEQNNQKQTLDKERSQTNQIVGDLQKKEKMLAADIKKYEEQSLALNNKIEEMIKWEIAEAKRKAIEEEKKRNAAPASTPANPKNPNSSPSVAAAPVLDAKLSASFGQNKGKLPWPVDNGVIVKSFGLQNHPVYTIQTNNRGIDIKTNANAPVKAVFDGQVASVMYMPGHNQVIMVKHGDYFTVYSKLEQVYVKVGDKITAKQVIGTVHTDDASSLSEMHFELWQGTNNLNPALWIYTTQ